MMGFFVSSYADVIPPKKQLSLGIDIEDISCKEGFMRVYLTGHESPSCIKVSSVKKLAQKSIIEDLDLKQFDKLESAKPQEIGTAKVISIVQSTSKIGKSKIPTYDVVFNACSTLKSIVSPTVLLKSDTESRQVKLADDIGTDSCQLSVGLIQAANPDSISIQLTNQGAITQKINDLTDTINKLQSQLEEQRTKLALIIKNKQEKTDEALLLINQISETRKQLNDTRDELFSYQFSLNASQTTKDIKKLPVPTPRQPSEGTNIKIISKYAAAANNSYDVAFEACSGNEILRIPIITVTSDLESKAIQLGDKIPSNSCVISGIKVTANDPESIQVSYGDSGARSAQIDDLDKQLADLDKSLKDAKKSLSDLVNAKPKPSDYSEQVDKISQDILKLRSDILSIKSVKYGILATR